MITVDDDNKVIHLNSDISVDKEQKTLLRVFRMYSIRVHVDPHMELIVQKYYLLRRNSLHN